MTKAFSAHIQGANSNHERGPEFDAIDDAVVWAKARSSTVIVMLGVTTPSEFFLGEPVVGDDGRLLEAWPPAASVVERLIVDMDSDFERSMSEESGEFPATAQIEVEDH